MILINGYNNGSAGGLTVLKNFVSKYLEENDANEMILVPPKGVDYNWKCNVIDVPRIYRNNFIFYFLFLKSYIRKNEIQSVLNFSDIPLGIGDKEVYYFDWPYLIYPASPVWSRMNLKDLIFRKLKALIITYRISRCKLVVTQTFTARSRLNNMFNQINLSDPVPNGIDSTGNASNSDIVISGEGFKFFVLTRYYPHKNLEVLIEVAEIFREKMFNCQFIMTLDMAEKAVEEFFSKIQAKKLSSYFINLGTIDNDDVSKVYSQIDALVLPTLLESFSGTYIDAMYRGKDIFTSDIDFAREICGDAAAYFDPLSSIDIAQKLLNYRELSFQKKDKGYFDNYKWEIISRKLIRIVYDSL